MPHYFKTFQEKGLILNFMNRNLVSFYLVSYESKFIWLRTVFDTKCVACLHRFNETGKFVFATASKYAVCLGGKRMEKVFRRF